MATPPRIQSTTPTPLGALLGDGSGCPPGDARSQRHPDGHPTTPSGPDVNMNNALGCNAATIGLGLGVLGFFTPPGEVSTGIASYGGTTTAAVLYTVTC